MNDDKLPWQSRQWQLVEDRFRAGRFPHAVLLRGPRGVGKSRFAERLANLLLCMEPPRAPCGTCRGCALWRTSTHPDLSLVEPGNADGSIGIDQIRQLIGALSFTAKFGSHKVGIIQPADRMTAAAANSLLKTLEEPPGNSVLVLVATMSGLLPATIRSRCQSVDLPSVTWPQCADWLANQLPNAPHRQLLLTLASGQPFTALTLAGEGELEVRKALCDDLHELLGPKARPVETAERWRALGVHQTIHWLTGLMVDLIRLGTTRDPRWLTHQDLLAYLQPLIHQLGLKGLFGLLDACAEASRLATKHTGLNHQLMLEDLAISCSRAACGQSNPNDLGD